MAASTEIPQKYQGNDVYRTTDTAEAGWLYSQEFELLEVINNNYKKTGVPSIFVFRNNSHELAQAAFSFQSGEAIGNVYKFFRAYRMMLGRAMGRQE